MTGDNFPQSFASLSPSRSIVLLGDNGTTNGLISIGAIANLVVPTDLVGLATVAKTGSYNDLSNTPVITNYALLASPTFTGTPILATPPVNNTTPAAIATTGYVNSLVGTYLPGAVAITGGSINATTIGITTPGTGAFTSLSSTGGGLNGTIGSITPSTGSFTSLSSTSGALNGSIGSTTPAAGSFTSLNAFGLVNSNLGDQYILPNSLQVGNSTGANLAVYNPYMYGLYNLATTASFIGNNGINHGQIAGGTFTLAGLAGFPTYQNVTLYAENTLNPPLIIVTAPTFDSVTLFMPSGTPLSTPQIASLKKWMRIHVTPVGNPWIGMIQSVASNGLSITVLGWIQAGNATPGTPPGGVGTTAWIDAPTQAETMNLVLTVDANTNPQQLLGIPCGRGTGLEIDIVNNNGTNESYNAGIAPRVSGMLIGMNGSSTSGTGIMVSGTSAFSYVAQAAATGGFCYSPTSPQAGSAALLSQTSTGYLLLSQTTGNVFVDLTNDGTRLQLGAGTGGASNPINIDLRSSGNTLGDCRLTTTGGSSTSYSGTFQIKTGTTAFYGATLANALTIQGSATGSPVVISATGDTNLSINLVPAGSGGVNLSGVTTLNSGGTCNGSWNVTGNFNPSGGLINMQGCGSTIANFQFGSNTVATSPFFDFHSSGNAGRDYRITASGGTSSLLQGTLTFQGLSTVFSSPVSIVGGLTSDTLSFGATTIAKINLFSTSYGIGVASGNFQMWSNGNWTFNTSAYNGAAVSTISSTGLGTFNGGLNLPTAITPASASAAGTTGTIAWDTGFLYVCTATNTWKRVAIATW